MNESEFSFVGEECMTSPKSVCVGGYKDRGFLFEKECWGGEGWLTGIYFFKKYKVLDPSNYYKKKTCNFMTSEIVWCNMEEKKNNLGFMYMYSIRETDCSPDSLCCCCNWRWSLRRSTSHGFTISLDYSTSTGFVSPWEWAPPHKTNVSSHENRWAQRPSLGPCYLRSSIWLACLACFDLKNQNIRSQSMKVNWNFLGGRGLQDKNPSMGGVFLFLKGNW